MDPSTQSRWPKSSEMSMAGTPLPIYLSIYLSTYLQSYLPTYLSTYLLTYVSTYLSTDLCLEELNTSLYS